MSEDLRYMQLALALGRRGQGRTWPNPAVGAVIVKDGVIVGRGWTQPGGRPHAEPEALKRAGEAARSATLYVTLEPCSHFGKSPPCADAIIAAGIARVVSAVEDPNREVGGQGHARVDVGLCAEEAARDHAGHFLRVREKRPVRYPETCGCRPDEKIAAAGPSSGRHHWRDREGAGASLTRAKRCHPGRHRARCWPTIRC